MSNSVVLIILGVIQGIAEFLPISSSGHLVIIEHISVIKKSIDSLGDNLNLFINVTLHVATLIAVIIFLRKDILNIITGSFKGIINKDFKNSELNITKNIIIASIPAGIIGLLFHDFFTKVFSSPKSALSFLIINGIILIFTNKITINNRKIEETGTVKSIIIGFFQAIALIPGISRSGMTIAGGIFTGLDPEESAKFSFLMAIPVIAGAGLLEGIKAVKNQIPYDLLMPLGIASIITIIVALFSMKILFILVKKVQIHFFGYYTIIIGISGLIYLSL